jgi:hypothetical protein
VAVDEPRASEGTGIRIRDLGRDARELPACDFEERHGSGYLLRSAAENERPTDPAATQVALLVDLPSLAYEESASFSLLAYPLVRSRRSVAPLVSIGRTSNSDVVIPDLSVSRFHAFLKPLEDGRFQLQDAGSVNGSAINGDAVPRQGSGPPMDLKSGDNVRLGRVELTFLDADALREFVLEHDPH